MMVKLKSSPGIPHLILRQLKEWFSKNILLKIAALALAVFLWFNAATNRIQQEEYSVPISIVIEDTSLVDFTQDYGRARILFEGQGKEFLKLLWNKPRFEFAIDEKKPKKVKIRPSPGDVIIPEGISLRPLAVLEPEAIEVELDWLVEKTIPVLPVFEMAEEGFIQKGKITADPTEINVRGARKEIKGLKSVPTELIELPSTAGNFEVIARIDLSKFQTLTTYQETVKIRGEIERIIERKLEDIPVEITGMLRKDYRANPETINILVTGRESRIASLTPKEIKAVLEINTPPSGETYYSPKIVLPENVELISEQPKLFQAVLLDSIQRIDSP
ncbi:MAG: YbbR-like domain-containing protein [Candidatus Glassbacteria bacterium]